MLTSVTQFLTSVINLYSFPIEFKPKIGKFQIYETVKITKIISSLSEDITFVIFTVYLIEKSLYFIGKHIRKSFSQYYQALNDWGEVVDCRMLTLWVFYHMNVHSKMPDIMQN